MSAGSNADQILRYKGFNVEIKGVDDSATSVDAGWTTMSVGERETEPMTRPAFAREIVEEISLRGSLAPGREAMAKWLNDTATGGDRHRTVTVTLEPLDVKDPLEVFIFEDAYITGYVFPPLVPDDPCPPVLIEELRFAYGRLLRLS